MEAKQTPLIELLERVPQDARVVVEHDQFSSSSHPVGRLCHEAAAALRAALAQEQAEPLNLLDRAVQRRLAAQWGYVPAQIESKPLEPDIAKIVSDNLGKLYVEDPAEPAQEPVGEILPNWSTEQERISGTCVYLNDLGKKLPVGTKLYSSPPKAEPVQEQATPQQSMPIRATVFDDAHPNGIPLEQWVRQNRPVQRQPLSGLEVERLLEQVVGSLPAARNLVRAVERAHGIIESEIKVDSHQTLDDAMQQPRAMAQAYERGYNAGAAAERKRIIQFLTEMQRVVGDAHNHYGVAAVRIKERV